MEWRPCWKRASREESRLRTCLCACVGPVGGGPRRHREPGTPRVERDGAGFGFDLISGQVCEMIPNGILDVATVQKQAVISAIRSAAMALTIDVLVHRKKPPVVTNPDAPGI